MSNITDPFRQIFLAGVGALAMGADKSQDIIRAQMQTMTKEQRDAFAARVAEMAASVDGDDALRAQEASEL